MWSHIIIILNSIPVLITALITHPLTTRKWLIAGAYKPLSMSNNEFTEHFSIFADRSLINYEHMLLFGDLNFDMLNSDKSATLNDFCDIFNLSQLVNGPTSPRFLCRLTALIILL